MSRARERLKQNKTAAARGKDPSLERARQLLAARAVEEDAPVTSPEPAVVSVTIPPVDPDLSADGEALEPLVRGIYVPPPPKNVPHGPGHGAQGDPATGESAPVMKQPGSSGTLLERAIPKLPGDDALYRDMMPGDFAYIVSTWARSAPRDLPISKKMGTSIISSHAWRARRLVHAWGARVACDPMDPEAIWAWACLAIKHGHTPRVLYVYVREDLRKQGYCRGLLAHLLDQPVVLGCLPYARWMDKTGRPRPVEKMEGGGTVPAPEKLPAGWRYSHIDAIEWALCEGER